MKKKTMVFSLICMLVLFSFSGCGKKDAITEKKFEEKAEDRGYTVTDATYALKANGEYMYLSRIDNTLIYIKEDANYYDDIKEFTDSLGY